MSGHFYFRQNWFADNGMIPALLVLERIGREGRPLSSVLEPLRARYHISGEINSRVEDVPRALARVEERYRDGRVSRLDGISIDYDDWHFNVRPSNTEPLLRLNLEAYTKEAMERRRDEVLGVIRQESAFDARALSPAGAQGLMQLMPGTARSVAADLGVGYQSYSLTSSPDYNISLGRAYLAFARQEPAYYAAMFEITGIELSGYSYDATLNDVATRLAINSP